MDSTQLIQSKEKMEKGGNKEQMGPIENENQDEKLNPNCVNNHIKCKWSKSLN
jgi:hypothetical protein